MNESKSAQILLDVNFNKTGSWTLSADGTQCSISKLNEPNFEINNVLYAFTVQSNSDIEEIKYIGKTTQTLNQRFIGYAKPGKSQQTNLRVNNAIINELKFGKKVSIYIFKDVEQLNWGGYNLNIASGLEDSLVYEISPEWNKAGRKLITSTEELENQVLDSNLGNIKKLAFNIKLGHAYYTLGFMNPGKKISDFMGGEGELVSLKLPNGSVLKTKIDRNSNPNGSVRLSFGKELANFYQSKYQFGDTIEALINIGEGVYTIELS
ncbi:hypothetical protein [Sediminicola arcticus]|uniref:GIY-YIG domain-containing protein n=1 Tax=Sediminicola arcticus TaxID=1574308 RepID=A0ABV2SPU9_9FLAO